jgi:hypothetical protein
MVNNLTNINKANNQLSPTPLNMKRPQHMMLEIKILARDRLNNVVRLNRLYKQIEILLLYPNLELCWSSLTESSMECCALGVIIDQIQYRYLILGST